MARFIRVCPHCYPATGDTFEFQDAPPIAITCDECGSQLKPHQPENDCGPEGWLYDRDYSEAHDPAGEYA